VRREELSKEEIREIVSSRPGFHKIERTIIAGALELAERPLRDITVPRPSIVSVAADADVKEGLRTLQTAGISRAPVIGETIDEVVGVLHIRDLIGKEGPVSSCARDILALPETLSVMKALAEMQKTRTQLAVVVDEYGGTEGLVTIEDILEEIVGEIYDEFDVDVASVVKGGSETYLPGHFPIHDAKDIGLDLPDGEYSTIAGLIMHRLGRMPEKGDALQFDDLRLEVLRTTGRTVERVRVTKSPSTPVAPEED
jgi:putative hemolysin